MAKSPEEMAASMIANLKAKTGKTLPQWLKLAKASGAAKHGELVKFLKSEHGLTHGYANLIAHEHLKSVAESSAGADATQDDPVATQYSGKKAELRPIYDKLVQEITKLGKDVELAPKKTYVSVRRAKQFALIQPSTSTRIDVGIQLKGDAPTDRLEASGSFNSMVSHRVRVSSLKDVDAELRAWLRAAYERAE